LIFPLKELANPVPNLFDISSQRTSKSSTTNHHHSHHQTKKIALIWPSSHDWLQSFETFPHSKTSQPPNQFSSKLRHQFPSFFYHNTHIGHASKT